MGKKNFGIKYTEPNIKGNSKINTDNSSTEMDLAEEGKEQGKNLKDPATKDTTSSDNQKEQKDNETQESNKSTARKMTALLENPKSHNLLHDQNPFLLTKEKFDPASVIKTGYKMRISYKQTLKLMAETKKGYTIEALLDEALSDYIDKNPDARKAFEVMKTMMSA